MASYLRGKSFNDDRRQFFPRCRRGECTNTGARDGLRATSAGSVTSVWQIVRLGRFRSNFLFSFFLLFFVFLAIFRTPGRLGGAGPDGEKQRKQNSRCTSLPHTCRLSFKRSDGFHRHLSVLSLRFAFSLRFSRVSCVYTVRRTRYCTH